MKIVGSLLIGLLVLIGVVAVFAIRLAIIGACAFFVVFMVVWAVRIAGVPI